MNVQALRLIFALFALAAYPAAAQQNDWPRVVDVPAGKITIYQPQPESFEANRISSRSALSYTPEGGEPVFGAIWSDATVDLDRDSRTGTISDITITNVKFPEAEDEAEINKLKSILESEVPRWNLQISLDALAASLELVEQEQALTADLKNDPPEVIYVAEPSLLVLIDGDPKIQKDDQLGMERIVNSPYLIVRNDGTFYLYVTPWWFSSASATGDWVHVAQVPKRIKSIEKKVRDKDAPTKEPGASDTIPAILVRTDPAELIQSRGEAQFKPIQGTSLLYMSNTEGDVFMDINSQKYFVLISGRWYNATSLRGPWDFIDSKDLPADFRKIPEGSEKDNVLASIAGTAAAKDAVANAQVPQTAKVERKTATTTVVYDGSPKFEDVPGTGMQYAVNTQSTVLRDGSRYYSVDNGVWFEAEKPEGPWTVATERPGEVEKIPPSNPTYNVKYVYIYDTTPEYVYVGYTPGYLGCYIYGPVVVYGTGWYYRPWYGVHYYPRPCTWGFGMHYNPWTGWSMSVGFSTGGFSMSFGWGGGGWWGPPVYRPPYRPPYHRYYGGHPVVINQNININNININHTNNIYNHRKDVVTRDIERGGVARGNSQRPTVAPRERQTSQAPSRQGLTNNIQADRNGNIYRKADNGEWQQRQDRSWAPAGQSRDLNHLDQVQQSRDRGMRNTTGFRQTGGVRPSAGGMRRR